MFCAKMSCRRKVKNMLFGKHINRYYIKHLPALLFGLAALILVDYVQLLVPEFYRMIISGINNGYVTIGGGKVPFTSDFLLDRICLPMIFIILAMVVARFLWRICFFGSGIKVETDLRSRMFDHLKDLPREYYQANKVGNLMSLFTNDLETVQECFGNGIMMFCDALFLGALSFYKMFRMNTTLAALSLIPIGLMLAVGLIVGFYMQKKWKERQEAFSALSDFSEESFSGIAVIKAFVKEAKELMLFERLNKKNEKVNVEYTRLSVAMNIAVTLLVETMVCVILGFGGYLVYEDIFEPAQLMEFIGYFTAIVWPIMAVSQLIEMQSRGKASLKRISELLDEKNAVTDRSGVKDCPPLVGNITFKDLSFAYPDGQNKVLEHVSLEIKQGERIGVIGKVGCGKTTLVDLILRTYNVPDGTLFLDGYDVNDIPIHTVRQYTAYVPQDNFLFSDTIENNISFATDEVSFEKAEQAAKLADIHENILDFPRRYQTVLGERGVTVSGGQKQRISIARALMKDAPILIMDDAVSAVDVKTEKKILSALYNLRQGKTTILIAHRVSTVEEMDRIVYMDEGKIVDVGSHKELYDRCQAYRNMVDLQALDGGKEG